MAVWIALFVVFACVGVTVFAANAKKKGGN